MSPMADLGAGLRGIKPFGNFRFGYSAYVINGPQLLTDTLQAGMIQFGMEDNNPGKAIGGRLELVRLSKGNWEVGLSGILGDAGPDNFESITALGALDFSHQAVSTFLHGMIDLKSQVNWINIDREDYGTGTRFQNQSWHYVVQLAYRPSLMDAQWIRNLEAVCRVAQLQYPHDALWSKEGTEVASGLNYWLNWNSLLKVAWIVGGGEHKEADMPGMPGMPAEEGSAHSDGFTDGKLVVQMAIGL
jgi:hypothetical protein